MVQNPEARNLDPINNTSCSPMVPVQPCYIAEWKKMAWKNKKLIKKLEAKQKKALQRKFLSPECLMSLYQQSWQNDWNLAYRMPREYEIHSRSLEKTYQRYYRRKNDNHFSGPCKKTDKESNSMTWMAKSRFTGYPKYTTLPTSSPHHRITKFLQKHYWFVRQLYSCGTRYSQKDRFASQMFFTVQIPDNSTARFPDQCHFISPKHDRYHPECNFSDPDQKNPSVSCFFITTVTDSRSNKA